MAHRVQRNKYRLHLAVQLKSEHERKCKRFCTQQHVNIVMFWGNDTRVYSKIDIHLTFFIKTEMGFFLHKCHMRYVYLLIQSNRFDGREEHWFHVSCFSKGFKESITSVLQFEGFSKLRYEDQERLKDFIGEFSSFLRVVETKNINI